MQQESPVCSFKVLQERSVPLARGRTEKKSTWAAWPPMQQSDAPEDADRMPTEKSKAETPTLLHACETSTAPTPTGPEGAAIGEQMWPTLRSPKAGEAGSAHKKSAPSLGHRVDAPLAPLPCSAQPESSGEAYGAGEEPV